MYQFLYEHDSLALAYTPLILVGGALSPESNGE
jgi:hypothetical protein